MGDMAPLLAVHAYSAANWLAMHCRRHMHLYGTTKEQLGWLAVERPDAAAETRLAVYREPITMDDYLAARPVSDTVRALDCDVPVDGSIAVVVSAADHADGCPSPPVRVEALAGGGAGGWTSAPDYPKMASVEAAADLWSRTDLRPPTSTSPSCTTGSPSSRSPGSRRSGFCGDGERGPFVEGGGRGSRSTGAPSEHVRRAVVGRAHARLLGAARGVPAAPRRGR